MENRKILNVLVDCEESQTVAKEFRALGHNAYSCDLLDCSGGNPEFHLKMDALKALYRNGGTGKLTTQSGDDVFIDKWDLVIAHPVCKRLANSGVLRLYIGGKKINDFDPVKLQELEDARNFFMAFYNYDGVICIENPVQHLHARTPKHSQTIQPWQFGDPESKRTCLWLKGLPLLKPTNVLTLPGCGHWNNQTKDGQNKLIIDGKWIGYNDPRTASYRAKTYPGIAKAMATQWSEYIINQTP